MAIYLGEFEELVLLTVAALGDQAYGVSIQQDIETQVISSRHCNAVHLTLVASDPIGNDAIAESAFDCTQIVRLYVQHHSQGFPC